MTLPANIRINALTPFPSLVTASGPITLTKNNGVWTVGFGNIPTALNMGQAGLGGTPAINFYSSGLQVQYDTRLIALGGNSNPGGGTLVCDGTFEIVPQAASLQTALETAQSAHGTTGNTQLFNNLINITSDDANTGNSLATSFSLGLYVQHNFGGSNATGGREAIFGNLILGSATNSGNANRFYAAVSGQAQANSADGGSLPGSPQGLMYGSNFLGVLGVNGATGFQEVGAGLDQTTLVTGSSSKSKSLRTFSYGALDAVQGSTFDAALMITADTGASAGGKNAILIGNMRGAQPLATNGAVLTFTGSPTIGTGIDLSGATISGNAYRSNGFNVDGSGNVSGNSITVATFISSIPATLTGTSGSTNSTSQIINASGTFTLTLPSASGSGGRWLYIKSIAAQIVNSASSNVVPLAGGSAGTAILAATAGKWCWLQSDGSNWIIMAAN